jgi:nucleoid-associated protein YgaU
MQVIMVTGGNLFQLAAQYLGDATQWVRIAQLNDIRDPWLTGPVVSGPVTLKLPDLDPSAGGGVGQQ